MRVARLHGAGDIRLDEEPDPTPRAGEELIRITAVGVCGSDLHWWTEGGIGDATLQRPLVLGHEFAGVIVGGPRHGRRVAVDPAIPCGSCELCHDGKPNLCRSVVFAGHGTQDGALRELIAWPVAQLFELPDGLDDADGAMLEPLGVALHALDLCHVGVGDVVGVFGCGPIGLLLLQLVRAAGAATVVASDPLPHRRQAAERLGADLTLDPTTTQVDEVADRCDVVFDVSGTDAAIGDALRAARPGSRVGLVGIPEEDRTTFTASTARRKGLSLLMVRRMGHTYPRAIQAVVSGVVDVRSIVTHRLELSEVATAFEIAAGRTGLKVIVGPDPR